MSFEDHRVCLEEWESIAQPQTLSWMGQQKHNVVEGPEALSPA